MARLLLQAGQVGRPARGGADRASTGGSHRPVSLRLFRLVRSEQRLSRQVARGRNRGRDVSADRLEHALQAAAADACPLGRDRWKDRVDRWVRHRRRVDGQRPQQTRMARLERPVLRFRRRSAPGVVRRQLGRSHRRPTDGRRDLSSRRRNPVRRHARRGHVRHSVTREHEIGTILHGIDHRSEGVPLHHQSVFRPPTVDERRTGTRSRKRGRRQGPHAREKQRLAARLLGIAVAIPSPALPWHPDLRVRALHGAREDPRRRSGLVLGRDRQLRQSLDDAQ